MKTILTSALLCTLFSQPVTQPEATLQFEQSSFFTGKIPQGISVVHTYEFTNSSDRPITITQVEKDCDCTTVNWTKSPIKPGGKGTVTTTYNPSDSGEQRHSFAVSIDASKKKTLLWLSANVEATK